MMYPPQLREEKPSAAFALSLVGAIIVLLVAFVIFVGGAASGFGFMTGFGFFGIVWGVLMLVFGILLYAKPGNHVIWGVMIIIFSVLSWFGSFGGFFIGFILGLIGGILGVVWKPASLQTQMPPYAPPMSTSNAPTTQVYIRVCLKCGRQVDPQSKFCPHCGAQLP